MQCRNPTSCRNPGLLDNGGIPVVKTWNPSRQGWIRVLEHRISLHFGIRVFAGKIRVLHDGSRVLHVGIRVCDDGIREVVDGIRVRIVGIRVFKRLGSDPIRVFLMSETEPAGMQSESSMPKSCDGIRVFGDGI